MNICLIRPADPEKTGMVAAIKKTAQQRMPKNE
jgi:hypothetical protein